jgi:hypothetical protein
MTARTTLFLCLLTLVPIVSIGCSAQYTYTRAVGSWKSDTSIAPVEATTSWVDRMRCQLEHSILADIELKILPSGQYTVKLHGREFTGQARITSLLGGGLGVATEIGTLEAEGRIRIVDENHMILEGNGTEISLIRCR